MITETKTHFRCDCCQTVTDKYSQVGFTRFWFQKYDVCKECYNLFVDAFDKRRRDAKSAKEGG